MITRQQTEKLLCLATNNPDISFRDGQWEAIDRLVNHRGRVLVVQRTGWGKSMVYFLSARLLREQGAGPTLIISPLLALMRNQIAAAQRLGLHAATINSANQDEWQQVRNQLLAGQVDLLLISPERLANDEFIKTTLLPIAARIGLLVVDEAHCISDWGHDFRPDYRRIVQVLRQLPPTIPVLTTTATANRRVVADIEAQLGTGLLTLRGPLLRTSLYLQNLLLPNPAMRLAWLADHINELPGSGIVYTLTVRDCERVAKWLQAQGIKAAAYHSDSQTPGYNDNNTCREALEQQLLHNELKCLVATTALGMGYDKPDLGFVVHYQSPGSVIFYYQQVGRAGRAIDKAYGILLAGEEDIDINQYFMNTAFPPEWQVQKILTALAAHNGLTLRELEGEVNLRQSQIEKVLKLLMVEESAPVMRDRAKWYRTINPFQLDQDRIAHLTHQRRAEWAQIQAYLRSQTCLMEFLAQALDDETAQPCGKCAVCTGEPLIKEQVSPARLAAAQRFLRHSEVPLEPKKQWAAGAFPVYGWRGNIPEPLRAETGRILARWNEPGWGEHVKSGKEQGRFADELVTAAAEMIRERWLITNSLGWVTCIPSLRHKNLVSGFAARLAGELNLPLWPVIRKVHETAPQKEMQNRFHQCHNLDGAFEVVRAPGDLSRPVLLVDDICDSGWTLAIAAALLRQAGSGPVYPLVLAATTAK